MGSEAVVVVPAGDLTRAGALVRALFGCWEATLSRFLPASELSRLNAADGEETTVGSLLLDVLSAALEAARLTRGLYDPTLLRHLVAAGYDRPFDELVDVPPAPRPPGRGGAWRRIVVDRERSTVTLPRGAGVDLGGIAKGMAVDAAVEGLTTLGVEGGIVAAGGDLRVFGGAPAVSWPILVADVPGEPVVPLVRGALATSGVTRRRWLQGGRERHHVLDPRTGDPVAGGLVQVTVAAGTCRAAEVWATAALVAGPILGRMLLERHGLSGLAVDGTGRAVPIGAWPRAEAAA